MPVNINISGYTPIISPPRRKGNLDNYKTTSDFIQEQLGNQQDVENENTSAISGGPGDPNKFIFRMFQIGAVLGKAYNRLKNIVDTRNQEKEDEKETQKLAFA